MRKAIDVLEGGAMHSYSLRIILRKYYQVEAGPYSYGPCLKPGVLPPGTVIGNYCSFADGINFFRRNHPKDRLSTHPFFYNHTLGFVRSDTIHAIADNPLRIGHDVWIGFNAMILPNCRVIGDGAIVGAGAVVTKDVPAFGIVVGNPGKLIGYRFTPEVAAAISKSNWWLKSIEDLGQNIDLFLHQADPETIARLCEHTSPRDK